MRLGLKLSLALALVLNLLACLGGGTEGANPIQPTKAAFSVEFGPNLNMSVPRLTVCATTLRFIPAGDGDSVSTNISVGSVSLSPSGTPLTTASIPVGTYQSVQVDLSPSCVSGQSVQLTNPSGTFVATSSMTLNFQGTFSANSSLQTLTLNIQPFVDALVSVNNASTADSEIQNAAASAVGSPAPSASGSVIFQQSASGSDTYSSSMVSTGNFPGAVQSGNLMVCVITSSGGDVSVTKLNDTHLNSYRRALGPVAGSGSLADSRLEIWYAANITSSSPFRVAAYFSTFFTGYKAISCFEYSGAASSNPLDQVSSASGNGISPASSFVTTTSANELIFSAGIAASETPSNGPGFTLRATTANHEAYEDKIVHTVGSYNAPYGGIASAQDWLVAILTFKAQ